MTETVCNAINKCLLREGAECYGNITVCLNGLVMFAFFKEFSLDSIPMMWMRKSVHVEDCTWSCLCFAVMICTWTQPAWIPRANLVVQCIILIVSDVRRIIMCDPVGEPTIQFPWDSPCFSTESPHCRKTPQSHVTGTTGHPTCRDCTVHWKKWTAEEL